MPNGRLDLLNAGGSQDRQTEVAQRGKILRRVTFLGSAIVLAHHGITHPVQFIFDAPMPAIELQQFFGRSPLGAETGDRVNNFFGCFASSRDLAFDATDLLDTWPVQVACQATASLKMPTFKTTMAFAGRLVLGQLFLSFTLAVGGSIRAENRRR